MNTPTPRIRPPRRYRRIIDRVSDRDREYFARHQGAHTRIRPYVPGEAYPFEPANVVAVLVTQLAPGVRHRRFLEAPVRAAPGGEG